MTSTPIRAAARAQNIPLGIGLMLLAIFMFSANDVLGKWLASTYSSPQILMFRSIAALAFLVPSIMKLGWRSLIAVPHPRLQILRATLGAIEIALFYLAVKYLPLADAMTYYLAGPIYVTVLAAVFLGEDVGWRRWTAVVAGFVGVVIAMGPSIGSFGWPVLIPFVASIIYAVFLTITRVLRDTPDAVMATWQIGFAFILGTALSPFDWTPIAAWTDILLIGLLGVVSLVAIIAVNRSLAIAPASVVVPYQYTMIIWAVIFGYFVFGDVPRIETLIGAAVIVCAGLFIYFREQQRGKELAPEFPPER